MRRLRWEQLQEQEDFNSSDGSDDNTTSPDTNQGSSNTTSPSFPEYQENYNDHPAYGVQPENLAFPGYI